MKRQIMHVDMDAFFAAVEQRDNPEYRNRPVIIGAEPRGRGVVSTASYEARKFGIHSAMPIKEAYRRCPDGIYLRPDIQKYREVSVDIYNIFGKFSPAVETVSLDEAFIDLTGTEKLWGSPVQAARLIKAAISEEVGLTASVGLGPNKFIAKIASDFQKPDGLVEVAEEKVLDFLAPLSVTKMWGVGRKTASKLHRLGISTIEQLRTLDKHTLEKMFGSFGSSLYYLARGIDASPVVTEREAKSLGREKTFKDDIKERSVLEETLLSLAQEVGWRLRRQEIEGKTVVLKLRDADFHTRTHQKGLDKPSNLDTILYQTSLELFRECWRGQDIRLIGITVTDLRRAGTDQLELFAAEADCEEDRLTGVLDQIRLKYGYDAITRARIIKENGRKN